MRHAKNTSVAASAWKLDSGWPPANWTATTAPRAATESGPGLRSTSSLVNNNHGSHANTLASGQASHTTKYIPNAKTQPATNAPPKRMPRARASRNVPNAAMNSLSAAMSASERQNGRTYAGALNGENTADCALPTNGRPSMMCGFHRGASGSRSRVYRMKGSNCVPGSPSWKFVPVYRTDAGFSAFHGIESQRKSDPDSVFPGSSAGDTNPSARTAYSAAARAADPRRRRSVRVTRGSIRTLR